MKSMDMVRALAAYVDIAPSHGSLDERLAFQAGWDAAMKFMAQPRIPTIEYPHAVGGMNPADPQFFEDAENPAMMRRGYNPHGLVAFYTDAPTCGCSLRQRSLGDGCGVCNPKLNKDAPDV